MRLSSRLYTFAFLQCHALLLICIQPAEGEKTGGTGTSIFDKQGAVGSMFNGKSNV